MSTLSKLFTGKSFLYASAAAFMLAVVMMFAGFGINQADAAKRGFKTRSSNSFQGISPGKSFSHRRHSGKRFSNRRFRNNSGFRRGFGNRGFRNRGAVNTINRAGVSLGHPTRVGNRFYGRKSNRRNHRNRSDRLFIHRRNTIEARNRRLNSNRSGVFRSDGIIVERYYQASGALVINVPSANTGNYSNDWSESEACPENHNCGYRFYSNGTGPRIIRISDDEVVGPSSSNEERDSDEVTLEELEVIN